MRTIIAVAGLMAAVIVAGPVTAGATGSRPDRSRLERDSVAIHDAGVTGVQARLVTADGRHQVATAGVADLTTGRPVPTHGRFRIASTAKTFMATVVLQLVGEDRMSLEDPVDRWLPGLIRGNDNDGRLITVRQLLQHTHGLRTDFPDYATEADYYRHRYDVYTPHELVARTLRHQPLFEPGAHWSYSTIGYVLLGMIIDRVTGQHWQQELQQRVIRPLGLKHTSWPAREPTLPRPHARAYQPLEEGRLVDVTEQILSDMDDAIVSTTEDLNLFFRALLGGRLLRPAQLAEMTTTRKMSPEVEKLMPDTQYGLGLFERPLPCGGTYWSHGGGDGGYITENGVTADGRRSVVVSMSSALGREWDDAVRQQRVADTLVGNALCGRT